MINSVILEGPNASGKSTLGEMLSRDLDLPYSHSGPNPGDTGEAVKACMDQLKLIKSGYIIDRVTPISRVIYDHEVVPELELIIFNKRLEELSKLAVIVYCCGDGVHRTKDYYPDGHLKEITEGKQRIRELYHEYMQGIDCIRYDWRVDSYKILLGDLREKLRSI